MEIEYPRLVLCYNCGRHGFFTLSDRTRTNGFVSKDTAHYVFKILKKEKSVSSDEVKRIKKMIDNSKLLPIGHKPTAKDQSFAASVIWYDMNTPISERDRPLPCEIKIYEEWPNIINY